MIKNVCYNLEYFDNHHCFPFEKKKVTFTLSHRAIQKLSGVKNKSAYIDRLLS